MSPATASAATLYASGTAQIQTIVDQSQAGTTIKVNSAMNNIKEPIVIRKGKDVIIDLSGFNLYTHQVVATDGLGNPVKVETALMEGIAAARRGAFVHDISAAVEKCARRHKLSIVRDYVGHGCGIELHEPPQIPNYTGAGRGPRLEPGMVLCIEPMLNLGTESVRVDRADGWTVRTRDGQWSAHYEHMILITENEPEILTWQKMM